MNFRTRERGSYDPKNQCFVKSTSSSQMFDYKLKHYAVMHNNRYLEIRPCSWATSVPYFADFMQNSWPATQVIEEWTEGNAEDISRDEAAMRYRRYANTWIDKKVIDKIEYSIEDDSYYRFHRIIRVHTDYPNQMFTSISAAKNFLFAVYGINDPATLDFQIVSI